MAETTLAGPGDPATAGVAPFQVAIARLMTAPTASSHWRPVRRIAPMTSPTSLSSGCTTRPPPGPAARRRTNNRSYVAPGPIQVDPAAIGYGLRATPPNSSTSGGNSPAGRASGLQREQDTTP